ncbi:MMPL family transporter [Thiomicrorhabdus sp. ZW0627]|uniref:MMPL family transporter n=1 Tax=Thiomicrorhabdus sp. ZW0627 TaxID=3039774 RepID=UPI00243744AA|nr:MMPL family transporter [Thiomicrorhabdus sp. ZW0627]MDG6774324.1 MMPL family transporter [Thiomicrorhabdus sp. ZW0627]
MNSSRPYLITIGFVALLIVTAMLVWPTLSLQNQLTGFFPKPQSSENRLLMGALEQMLNTDSGDQPVMISLSAPSETDVHDLAAISVQLKQALTSQKWVRSVENAPPPLSRWQTSTLRDYRYLFTDFQPDGLTARIQELWQAWQLGVVLDKKTALSDPTQQWLRYLQAGQTASQIPTTDGVWLLPAFESSQSQHALLLVNLQPNDTDALKSIRPFVESFIAENANPTVHARLSNAGLIALQAREKMQSELQTLSILATVTILLFLGFVFRNVVWVGLSFVPLAGATLAAAVVVNLLFGSIEVLTLALGVVLIGVTVDYPIHAFSALKNGRESANRIWPVIQLGGLTSLVGFLSLGLLDIRGIQQIAVFASVGIFTALMITRSMMLQFQEYPPISDSENRTGLSKISKGLLDRSFAKLSPFSMRVLLILLVGSLILVVISPLKWQDDLASLSPVPKSLLTQDGQLRKQFQQAEAGQFLLLRAPDVESLLQQQERIRSELAKLQQDGVIGGSMQLADFLPSQKLQLQRQNNLPETAALQSKITAAETPLQVKHFGNFFENVEKSKHLSLVDYPHFQTLALDWQKTLLPVLVSSIDGQTVGKVLLQGVTDSEVLKRWSEQHGLVYFHQREFVEESVLELRGQLAWVMVLFAFIIALFLIWRKRDFEQAWSVLVPVVLGLWLAFATLVGFGQALTVFHLLSALLVVAIGLDYSLFAQDAKSAPKSLNSVSVALMTTVISFGFLLFTQIPILVAIGQTLVLGVLWIYLTARLYHRV